MFKRIISLGLCLVMVALMFAGCGKKEDTTTTTSADELPATINLIGITDEATTQKSIDMVEEALNKISKTRYKTKIELTLVTADKYIEMVEEKIAEADQASIKLSAITKYNALAQKEANKAQKLMNESGGKKNNKWTSQVTSVVASTMATGEIYSAEQTTVYADGKIETVYPDAQSPIDILMIDGKEMYDYLNEKGYLLSVEKKLDEKFTKFRQYIYPTFFDQLKAMTGDINAIPNNNLLAEYTYLLIDQEIADAYNGGKGFNIDNVDNYDDLAEFLAFVKANYSDVAPLESEPEALGVFKYLDGEVAIGAYFDPMYGYDTAEGTDFEIQNLLAIPQYQAHVALMQQYRANGYIGDGTGKSAVKVVTGDASVMDEYSDKYDVKVIQNPFVTPDAIYDGMFAVSSYTSSEDRALEIIEMFTTDPEAKNILQYGIMDDGDNTVYANYKLVEVENGKFQVQLINSGEYQYKMDNGLTGNVYMGYPEPGQTFDAWTYYKQTNLDSKLSPFMLLYMEESALDDILASVLKRAALTDALKALDIDYDDYVKQVAASSVTGVAYMQKLRNGENLSYFIEQLQKAGAVPDPLNFLTIQNPSAAVQEFITFAESEEGQEILANAGYYGMGNGYSYDVVENLTGTINLYTEISDVTYIENAFNGLCDAFQALYPNVTINRPKKTGASYTDKMTSVNNANAIGLAYNKGSDALVQNHVADRYIGFITNYTHATYSQSWYETKLIEKVTAENYSNIISASDFEKSVQNKIAELGGAGNYRDKNGIIPNSQRMTLAAARSSANNYFNNIKYLRVMADEILFKNLSAEERARYDAMTDVAFEKAIFEYVRAHYEEQNQINDAEYEKRVQNFMVSVLEYASEEDSTVKYLVSWEEFIAAGEGSGAYMVAAAAIKEVYKDKLGYSEELLNAMALDKVLDEVYNVMYKEYLLANGYVKEDGEADADAFKAVVYDKFLNAVGTNYADFKGYGKTSDEYKNFVNKLRKKFKAVLISEISEAAYKNGEKGISNEKLVETLYNYYLEEELGIYKKMADMSGMSENEFLTAQKNYINYNKYITTMKTKYIYTLRAVGHSDAEMNTWTLDQAKENIFKALYETGFYTNEMARYIGQELSEYMLAKSEAGTYTKYLTTMANKISAELAAKGYDKAALLEGDGSELEAIAYEIVAEKFFSDKMGISEVVKTLSGQYVKDYTNVDEMKANADILSNDSFFMAVVNELQSMWDETKEAMNK